MNIPDKTDPLYLMAHELNNSFSSIYGSLRVIESAHPEVLSYKYWKDTMSDLEKTKNLLSDCLAASYSDSSMKEKI